MLDAYLWVNSVPAMPSQTARAVHLAVSRGELRRRGRAVPGWAGIEAGPAIGEGSGLTVGRWQSSESSLGFQEDHLAQCRCVGAGSGARPT